MNELKIITDSGCDLPQKMIKELDISVVPLGLMFRGELIEDSVDDHIKELYDALRNGEIATTSAINPDQWMNAIEPHLMDHKDVLVLTFSSGLSSTYQSAVIAAGQLIEKYSENKIRVVDTRCASLGQGLLVWYACKKRDEGMDIEPLSAWLEDMKPHLCHWFTVNDLMFLKRGGRISAATAIAGTVLNIKPVLHVDDEGHLINVSKTRGRKSSIHCLLDKMAETGLPGQNDTVFICHGDCIEDAEYMKKQIQERFHIENIFIGYTGTVIGSHSGPGTLALFFLGEKR